MAIANVDGWIASKRQNVLLHRLTSRTTVAAFPFTLFDQAGNPGAGTLAVGNTAAGTVPTDATPGFPLINPFAGGAKGYLAAVSYASSVACRLTVFDRLFAAGAYTAPNNTNLASIPSYAGRVPGGTDFSGLEIWIEQVTTFTGTPSFNITYTNQSGTTGRSTGSVSTGVATGTVGRMYQLPLQAGDSGVQQITNVTSTVATAGTFNVLVLRRLWSGRIPNAGYGDTDDLFKFGSPEIFDDSALMLVVAADAAASGQPEVMCSIASG